jgi:hypothetical protein
MTLAVNSDDRAVWRCAQANEMILLTANRSMKGKDSLEQVMREENTPTSLPVVKPTGSSSTPPITGNQATCLMIS